MAYIVLDLASDTEEVLSSGKCCAVCATTLKTSAVTNTMGESQLCNDCFKQEAAKYQEHLMLQLETY